MARVFYKSPIPNNKPDWLLKLQFSVSQALAYTPLDGSERDYKNLKSFIDAEIRSLYERGEIRRSLVETDLLNEGGQTTIRIFRNKNLVQTYFME